MARRLLLSAVLSAGLAFPVVVVAAQAPAFVFDPYVVRDEADGSWPDVVVVADVTGDGRDDVVLATGDYGYTAEHAAKSNQLYVYVQTTAGELADPIRFPHGGTSNTYGLRMQAADFNRDGVADIVVSHKEGISLLLARGGGRFDVTVLDLPGSFMSQTHAMAVGDLDGDRNVDIVRQTEDGVIILLGDGKGGFREQRTLAVGSKWHQMLRIGDVTGDKIPDLVMSNQLEMRIYPGRGDGSFLPARVMPYHRDDDTRGYRGLAIVDANHDGRNDVAATTASNQPISRFYLFEQQANGNLAHPPRDMWTYDMAEVLAVSDLDRNGYDDILVAHGGWYALGYYLQDRTGLLDEAGAYLPYASHYNPHGLATGDFDGDGCTDAAVADYNHGLVLLRGRNCFEPWAIVNDDPGDYDGDGQSDILWRSAANGQNVLWRSGQSSAHASVRNVTDRDWRMVGTGDFDGDGRSDLLWRHATTGQNAIWPAADHGSGFWLQRVADLAWTVVGIGDLDGDGQDDIVWRHRYTGALRVWDGGSPAAARSLTRITDVDWQIVGVGDFDTDGRDDLLWRHAADGRNVIWRGGDHGDLRVMPAMDDIAWQVAGVADFDGDGRTDVLWRHSFDGRNMIWPGANQAAALSLTRVADVSWKIAGVGDYSGDGRADIFWRNLRSGANAIWRDGNATSRQTLSRVSNLNWSAVR